MGAWIGLMLGVGVLLIWRSGPRAPQRAPRGSAWLVRRDELLHRAGITDVGVIALVAIQFGAAALIGLAVLVITSTLAIAACFAGFGFVVPVLVVRRMALQRQGDLREQWPEAVDNLASAVRAGMALPEAVAQLARRGPAPLRAPFARFASAYRSSGRFGECLDLLKAELADPVGDRVCETLRVAREVGGSDLGTVLRTLSELLREDARTRAELETRQGWVVNGARLAVAAPWLVLLMLGTQSQTVEAYDTPTGTLLLAIGAAACILAYRIMLRIGRLPAEKRVLQR
ncbi:MAG: Tight adherence protein [Pseudonocardiales bacterium]|nr:Tight adherence protein [Pseudonocardiales bacterium]